MHGASGFFIALIFLSSFANAMEEEKAKEPALEVAVDDQCVICLTEKSEFIVIPCFHRILCQECSVIMNDKFACPVCRTEIQAILSPEDLLSFQMGELVLPPREVYDYYSDEDSGMYYEEQIGFCESFFAWLCGRHYDAS